ncbi:hypothetical protein [Vibrio aestuarianus]|uniref:hypothetical protein n=2 Tax=Vibrio TaxID=662 RepID=UPI00237CE92C|nr:hypothetical protein [Vibrio aestuarianus]
MSLIEYLIVQYLANSLVVYRGRFPSAMPRVLDSTRSSNKSEEHCFVALEQLSTCSNAA